MITRREFLATSFVLASALYADDFEAYKKAQLSGVQAKKDDFESYKKSIDQAFLDYKRKIGAIWGDEEIGDQTKWANYSPDKESRSIVDFEKGELKLEIIAPKNDKEIAKKMSELAVDVASKTTKEAFNDDELLESIEKLSSAKPDSIENRPILSTILTGKNAPSQIEINSAIKDGLQKSTLTTKTAKTDGMQIYSLSIPLKQANIDNKAHEYKASVAKYAKIERIDPALVFAIMHSESNFNPMAKSHIPAFGLMQIVPTSAGLDATKKVYGKAERLSPSYLYNSDNNIKIGSAYIGILFHNYLSSIVSHESRIYCTIAAYNTGSGNVATAFGHPRDIKKASVKINALSPKQVYDQLVRSLPYAETRNYMIKVVPRYNSYMNQAIV